MTTLLPEGPTPNVGSTDGLITLPTDSLQEVSRMSVSKLGVGIAGLGLIARSQEPLACGFTQGSVDDIAEAALFLASPARTGFITGSFLIVDGGRSALLEDPRDVS